MKRIIFTLVLLMTTSALGANNVDIKDIEDTYDQCLYEASLTDRLFREDAYDHYTNMVKCEARLDTYLKKAAAGDDIIFDALMSSISKTNPVSEAYALRTERKLELFQQRSILKAITKQSSK